MFSFDIHHTCHPVSLGSLLLILAVPNSDEQTLLCTRWELKVFGYQLFAVYLLLSGTTFMSWGAGMAQ